MRKEKRRREITGALAIILGTTLFPLESSRALEESEDTAEIKGNVEFYAVAPLVEDSPDQNPTFRSDLQATLYQGSRFKLGSTLEIGYDGIVQGDNEGGGSMILDNDGYFDKRPYLDLEELYFDVLFSNGTFRGGIQKINWGVLDELQPTDNLNPEDLSEFLVAEEQERKIGIPAFRLTNFFGGDWSTDIAVVPVFFPARFGRPDTRWFPPLTRVEEQEAISTTFDGTSLDIPVQIDYTHAELGKGLADRGEVGLRISKSIGSNNFSVSYFNGLDPRPVFDIRALLDVTAPLGTTDISDATLLSRTEIFPTHKRIQAYGGDVVTSIGSITLRAEGAFYNDRPFNIIPSLQQISDSATPPSEQEALDALTEGFTQGVASHTFDLGVSSLVLQRDSAEYGVGIDYVRNTTLLSLQAIQDLIFDYDERIINKEIETILAVIYQSSWFNENLQIRLAPTFNFEENTFLGIFRVSYRPLSPLQFMLGYIAIQGDEETILGQFSNNDEIQLGAQYQF